MNVSSFDPVAREDARVLILGSMPGVASLGAQQYYAHPRNAFWPILAEACGFDVRQPYPERLEALQSSRIALWDVLASCDRDGSLDSAISASSMRPNDFAGFFAAHTSIRGVLCNGGTAYRLFANRVMPSLAESSAMAVASLPSTSPAYASMKLAAKREVWLRELRLLLR